MRVGGDRKHAISWCDALRAAFPYLLIYLFFASFILVLTSVANYLAVGNTLLANDELKFYYHAKGHIFGTELRTKRIEADFLGYAYISKWLISSGLDYYGISLKVLSLLASCLYIPCLIKTFDGELGFRRSHILYVMFFPLLLYYSVSGVRDAVFTLLFVWYVCECTTNSLKVFWLTRAPIILGAAFLIRPESVLILVAFSITYYLLLGLPSKRSFFALLVFLLLIVVFIGLYGDKIKAIYELYTLYSGKSSGGGFLAAARSLPLPLDVMVLGLLNVMGSFPAWNYMTFGAASNFAELGVSYNGAVNWAPSNILQVFGVFVMNLLFPINIILFSVLVKKIVKGIRLNRSEAIFITSFLLLFFMGRLSIEHGKSSAFYPTLLLPMIFLATKIKPFGLIFGLSGIFLLMLVSFFFIFIR